MKLVDLRSLALRTDLEILRFEGVIKERDGYLVAETPGNPGFYWGNLLVFPDPPRAEDVGPWQEAFRREFAHQPAVQHMTFTWDCPAGRPGVEFPGFRTVSSPVQTLRQTTFPARYNSEIKVRPLRSDEDWAAALANQSAERPEGLEEKAYALFKRRQMERYRRMAEAGLGDWWGGFEKDQLIADCGLYLFSGVGRFQNVVTHSLHRRKGAAATLIFTAASHGLKSAKELVIVADPTEGADRVYASVGFQVTGTHTGACRWPAQ